MKYLIILVSVILIGGCSGTGAQKEAEAKRLKDLDHAECIARGFKANTPLFKQCIFALEEVRAAREMRQIKRNIEDMQRFRQDSRDRNF